jgi:hypothetical protein
MWHGPKFLTELGEKSDPTQLLGGPKSEGPPEHKWSKVPERVRESMQKHRDKKSPKVCSRLKSCESLYTCPRAPFYRETKRLLHSEITLESMEYPKCEHVHERLLHPVICGTNFIYLQTSHSFTPWTRTFGTTPLTWFIHDFRSVLSKIRRQTAPRSHRWNLCRSQTFTKLTTNSRRNRAFLSSWRSSKRLSFKIFWIDNDSRNLPEPETRVRPANSWLFGDCFAQG